MQARLLVHHPRLVVKFMAKTRGHIPNLMHPASMSEKYLWRKIVDRNPFFVTCCDKLATKQWVAMHHPDIPTAEVLWQGESLQELDWSNVTQPVFLKLNKASGTNLKLEPGPLDYSILANATATWMRRNLDASRGEWSYGEVPRRLFIEADLTLGDEPVVDFSVYVFGDEITHISVMTNHKTAGAQFARFDCSGRRMPIPRLLSKEYTILSDDFALPIDVGLVCDMALRVAADLDHMRVDLLWNGHAIYLTEMTVFPHSGFVRYSDEDLMERMAAAWDLSTSWTFTHPQTGWRKRYVEAVAAARDGFS